MVIIIIIIILIISLHHRLFSFDQTYANTKLNDEKKIY